MHRTSLSLATLLLARSFGYFATDAGLDEVASNAYGIDPSESVSALAEPTDLIERARGLKFHNWTFRNEQRPSGWRFPR